MSEQGWERRLENLARAQERAEESVDLTPGVVWTEAQLTIVRNLLARAVKAEAAVQRVEVVARRMRQNGVDSYAEDRDEAATARAVALYYAADQLFAALDGTP